MKNILGLISVFALTIVMPVQADPGAYDAFLTADSCDTASDGVSTACMNEGDTNIVDVINYLITNASGVSSFSTNEDLDSIQLTTSHSYWRNAATPGTFAYISIFADGFNTPGIYEKGNVSNQVMMNGQTGDMIFGDGSQVNPYPGMLNVSNNSFGVFVDHAGAYPGTHYSDPALNSNAYDQMMAFDMRSYLDEKSIWVDLDNDGLADQEIFLRNTYLLAFEDISLPYSDHDFNDSIFLLANVSPLSAPEPLTMVLLGSGLIGMAVHRRRSQVA